MPPAAERIAINALFLDPGVSGGVETFLRALVPELARQRPGARLTVVTTRAGGAALIEQGWRDFSDVVALRADDGELLRRNFAEQVVLPRTARQRGCEVIHSLASIAPIRAPMATVISLQDVTFFKHRTFGAVTTFGMRQVVGRAARNATIVVAAAEAMRADILEVLALDPAKVIVVPHGVGRVPTTEPAPEREVRARYSLQARIVLCVAAKRPHKNQELLIRALPALPDDVTLFLAGHPEPYDQQLQALTEQLGLEKRVRMPGYVPDEELERLWRMASVLALPPLFEGFGLPVLEAMARSVPVACSDIPVLREVGGDAALYFDPSDPDAAAGQITAAMDDQALVAAGLRRVEQFGWDRTASATLEAYDRAVAAFRSNARR